MKSFGIVFVIALVLFCAKCYLAYSEVVPAYNIIQTTTVDVNKDGKPDVTYYGEGKYVTRVEADTNYDGKPDVVMHIKDGKFESAEADTNYDGKTDKKFTDANAFNKWLNKHKPDFEDKLNRPDWRFEMMKF